MFQIIQDDLKKDIKKKRFISFLGHPKYFFCNFFVSCVFKDTIIFFETVPYDVILNSITKKVKKTVQKIYLNFL